MKIERKNVDMLRETLPGFMPKEIRSWVEELGFSMRVVREDEKDIEVTLTPDVNRLNIVIKNGFITEVESVG